MKKNILKNIITFLIIISLVQPVYALEPTIFIRIGMEENPVDGFYLLPPETTLPVGENVSFFNDDKNKRWFTVVSEEDLFPETTISYRKRMYYEFNEPGIYTFHLKERPTVKITLTITGNSSHSSDEAAQAEDEGQNLPAPKKKGVWGGLRNIPGLKALFDFLDSLE